MSELSVAERAQAVAYHDAGWTQKRIAERLGRTQQAISKTLKKVRETGSFESAPRSGRPPAMSIREKRRLVRDIDKHPGQKWREFRTDYPHSDTTLRAAAAEADIHKRVKRERPFLTPQQKTNRLAWAKNYKDLDWKNVMFTDESSVQMGEQLGRRWTLRRPGKENEPQHTQHNFHSGRWSLMVWGAIALGHKFPLHRINLKPSTSDGKKRIKAEGLGGVKYAAEIVKGPMMEHYNHLRAEREGQVYAVEDGAPSHTAKVSKAARAEAEIYNVNHPSSSPDLNAIEPLWLDMKMRIQKIKPQATNLDQLWEHIQQAWDEIPVEHINRQVEKMEERRKALLQHKGDQTGF